MRCGHPFLKYLDQLQSKFRSFPVLVWRTEFLGSVQPEQDGDRDPFEWIPRQWHPDGHDDPAMTECERDVPGFSAMAAITRRHSIVMHARAPDVWTRLTPQSVVRDGLYNGSRDQGQKLIKERFPETVRDPGRLAEKTVENRMVSLDAQTERYTDGPRNRVSLPAEDPPDAESDEVPKRWICEAW